jgi:hypothetical protein
MYGLLMEEEGRCKWLVHGKGYIRTHWYLDFISRSQDLDALPEQPLIPSPSYPALHAHVRVVDGGARSVHMAWTWHGCDLHAFVSVRD